MHMLRLTSWNKWSPKQAAREFLYN